MPTQTTENDDIRVKIIYNGEVQITYITPGISVDTLREEMRTICGFGAAGLDQFTMKWVDDEGDPCRIASQHELDEALRLYELEKDTEITIHEQKNH
ncbi:protein kinase C iota type-like isoform X3 [Apis cerana]|uniref:protein kinase C iota type-like isoform X3 n=2 Tax=Apis cerana TaxID=7461 RepID=UPI0007E2C606|nr:protein kinase C iota type-like isoform X3 [Apis cerana]